MSKQSEVEERIRQRAFQYWESEGRPEGKENEHWERARKEIEDSEKPEDPEKPSALAAQPPGGVSFGP